MLYLFHTLPVKLLKSYLLNIQALFNRFIWTDKPHRFYRDTLYHSPKRGGLGVPQVWLYYLVSRNITDSKVLWVRFKRDSITPLYLPGLLWSSKTHALDLGSCNLIVSSSLKLCSLYGDKFSLISQVPPCASFLGDSRLA